MAYAKGWVDEVQLFPGLKNRNSEEFARDILANSSAVKMLMKATLDQPPVCHMSGNLKLARDRYWSKAAFH